MKKKNSNKPKTKITATDYIKAVKKADREMQLKQFAGWQRTTKIHKNKKAYNRKNEKDNYTNEL